MAYVYFIKNKVTDQFYIGSRSKPSNGDFWIKYFTSSVYVKNLIHTHGKDSFEYQILFEYDDTDVCYWYEQLLIRETINDEKALNKMYVDPDNFKSKFATFGPKSEETKIKMRAARQRYFSKEENRKDHRDRIQKMFHEGRWKRQFTDQHRQSISSRVKEYMSHPESRENLRNKRLEFLSNAYNLQKAQEHISALNKSRTGVSLTQEHKDNISQGLIGHEITQEARQNLSNALKGKPKSEAAKEAFRKGWEKRKANGRDNNPFKEKVECPHCGTIGQTTCMKRWHFDNCRLATIL